MPQAHHATSDNPRPALREISAISDANTPAVPDFSAISREIRHWAKQRVGMAEISGAPYDSGAGSS